MLSLIGSAVVLGLILFLVVRSYAAQIAQTTQDLILKTSVTSILDAATIRNGSVNIELPYSAFSILSTPSDDRFFYGIRQDNVFLSGYETLETRVIAPGAVAYFSSRFDGSELRVAVATRRLVGANRDALISVTVAQTQEDFAGVLNRISRNAALFGFAFFVLVTCLSVWLTFASITPLTRLAASVQRRGPEDLSPVGAPVPREMAPLVGALNNLMMRLEFSLKQSEDFIAEAAHRVRTPLATVRSYAETTLQRVDKDENRQALRAMVRAIDESSRAAGQLLDHAMITFRADHLIKTRLNLADLSRDLIQSMMPIAEMRDVDLIFNEIEDVWVRGDAILLQNAMRNLIDNAFKYAPSETAIEITVSSDPPAFTVTDAGPGFPPDEMSHLANRFARGSNVGGVIGSGLGLTIVQDVAVAHGGYLAISNREEGGACAIFSL